MAHKFHPGHMAALESEERRRRQPPEALLQAMGLLPGMRLADIGAGPGFYSLPAAQRVGLQGHVYALDVQPPMLERLRERAQALGLSNLTVLPAEECGLPLPDGAVDAALLANVLHECADPLRMLREVWRILTPGGTLAVVEWRKEPTGGGPPLAERLAEEAVRQLLEAAGFPEPQPLEAPLGGTHFALVARRPQPEA